MHIIFTPIIVRHVLRSAALITLLLGIATLLAPQLIVDWFDGQRTLDDYHFVRFIGTALIGFSVMNWLYSRLADITATLPAIYGNLVSLTLAIVVDTVGIVFHTLPAAAWLILFVHLAFEAAFIYCVIGLKRATRRQDNG